MSERSGWFKRFVRDFGKVPDEAPKPLIPERLRTPVFLGMTLVSLVLLALLLWLVVLPAVRVQSTGPSHSQLPVRCPRSAA
jgi:hypothetical protein